jgi:hypothetical protein
LQTATLPVRGAAGQRASVLAAEQFAAAAAVGLSAQVDAGRGARTLPYSLVVHSYSNVSLQANTEQSGFAPGARVTVHASLAESGIPLARHAQTSTEVTTPDRSTMTVAMTEVGDGQFSAEFATTRPGVYRLRIRAQGSTLSGEPFVREQTLTAAVWRGGDQATDPGRNGQTIVDYLRDRDARLCELVKCLLQGDGVLSAELEKRLRALGVDVARARKCLDKFCH